MKRYAKWIVLAIIAVGYVIYMMMPLDIDTPDNEVPISPPTNIAPAPVINTPPPPKKIAPQKIILNDSSTELIKKTQELFFAKLNAEIRGANKQNTEQTTAIESNSYHVPDLIPYAQPQDNYAQPVMQNPISLHGIMTNNGKKTAFISIDGGTAFAIEEGETVNNIQVLKITPKSVVVIKNGRKTTLRKNYGN